MEWGWDHRTGKAEFQAIRDVNVDEELTHSYLGPAAIIMNATERQWRLSRYGFKCDCEACQSGSMSREISDTRRSEMKMITQNQATLRKTSNQSTPLDTLRRMYSNAKRLVHLLELEGLSGLALHRAYFRVAEASYTVNNMDEAALYVKKYFDYIRSTYDVRDSIFMEAQELYNKIFVMLNSEESQHFVTLS